MRRCSHHHIFLKKTKPIDVSAVRVLTARNHRTYTESHGDFANTLLLQEILESRAREKKHFCQKF